MQRLAAEAVEEQLAHQFPVVHVQPLRGRDEGPVVPGPSVLRGGEEEVDVEPRQGARVQAPAAGGSAQPRLPLGRDPVVPDIRGIADEQRGPRDGGQPEAPVVAQVHP